MIVGFDGTILREPRTGIGYYTHFLVQHLMQMPDGPQSYLYDGLRMQPAQEAGAQEPAERARLGKATGSRLMEGLRRNSSIRSAWRLFKATGFRHAARRLDLFHATNYLTPAPIDLPVLPLIHDVSHIRHPEWHPVERVRWLEQRAEEFRQAPLIHTVSEFSAREIAQTLNIAAERIHVTYPGVNRIYRSERPSSQATLQEAQVKAGGFFLCVGALEPRKNLATVIAAFSRLEEPMQSRFPLLVAGPAGWGDLGLPASSERLRQRGVLRFLGYVAEEQMRTLYRECTAFLFPSSYEGFGMPVSEAMAVGSRPIIAEGGAPQEVAGDHGLALPAMDEAAWTQAMRMAAEEGWHRDQEMRMKLREASRRFCWADNARATKRIYDKLLAISAGERP